MREIEPRELERLGEIADLSEDAPERVAFEQDAHRRVLLQNYLDFLAAESGEGSRPELARDGLADFLRANIEEEDAPPTPGRRGVPPRRARKRVGAPNLGRTLLVAAALLVIAVGLRMWNPDDTGPSGVRRGSADGELALESGAVADGRVELRWAPMEGADAYVVVLYRPDLSELRRLEPTVETSTTVTLGPLAAEFSGQTLVWRVTALVVGDVVGRSSVEYIEVP